MLSQPERAYRDRLAALREAVVLRVEAAYRDVNPDAIRESFDEFVARVAPTIEAGQDAAQQLTLAYLANAAAQQGLASWEPEPGDEDIPGRNRAGVPLAEAMGGIVPLVLGAIAAGVAVSDAMDSGRYYATRFADNEVRDASDREQERQETKAAAIVGWSGDAGECERCQVNNGDHSLDDEMYRHPGCGCVRTPIFAGE